ncbi:hypothetical protein GJ744_005550 [Endocarpon pusillum]|uniref:Uncharacterized protein n=1 Tax=Endocarpon pusillum TaxID=364733 RepID=A0A8H7AMQ9_9EURO|nr:hypothetical protein GJ744_005550 [Endocarpon pusillum]
MRQATYEDSVEPWPPTAGTTCLGAGANIDAQFQAALAQPVSSKCTFSGWISAYHAPSSFVDAPLTPVPTDDKAFNKAPRVIALFEDIKAGRHNEQRRWTEFQLAPGEYDEIEGRLKRNESLFGYVKDKIRYDYNGRDYRLIVRMPTGVHELFIDSVKDAIRNRLKAIYSSSQAATLPVGDIPHGTISKHSPDASFWHDDAQYLGVIIEVAYSQKRKTLARLAEVYLLDSDASVQVVVGLNIEYGKEESRKATMSVCRTHVVHTNDGDEFKSRSRNR